MQKSLNKQVRFEMMQYFKYIIFLAIIAIVTNVLVNVSDLDKSREIKTKKLAVLSKRLSKEEAKLGRVKKKHSDKLILLADNKINLTEEENNISKAVAIINKSKYFNARILFVKESINFTNVASAQIIINTSFQNFTLKDFEQEIKDEFKKVGHVLGMKFNKNGSGLLYLIVLKNRKGATNEKS